MCTSTRRIRRSFETFTYYSADSSQQTPLHYAKEISDHEVTFCLIRNGAKLRCNNRGEVNVDPKVLEEYLDKECLEAMNKGLDVNSLVRTQ